MTEKAYIPLKIWGSLLLAAGLASCSSPASQPISGPTDHPPSILPTTFSVSNTSQDDTEHLYLEKPSASSSPASPSPEPVTPTSNSAVEASNIPPTEQVLPPGTPFQPDLPSLARICLGVSDKVVVQLYGLPAGTYPLPSEKQSVDIWEYAGFSIGLNTNNRVVYIEITSSDVDTGIEGLLSGMNGAQAAQILGVDDDTDTNVLAVEVTGGWFKIDLDPETRQVMSLKLLSNEI
jgi:hypothetical protein